VIGGRGRCGVTWTGVPSRAGEAFSGGPPAVPARSWEPFGQGMVGEHDITMHVVVAGLFPPFDRGLRYSRKKKTNEEVSTAELVAKDRTPMQLAGSQGQHRQIGAPMEAKNKSLLVVIPAGWRLI